MRFALVMAALGVLAVAGVPVAAQVSLPVPPRAELRTFEWNEVFAVTPPFAQWTEVFVETETGARLWLHADSLRSARDRRTDLDLLWYHDNRYGRLWVTMECASRLWQIQAEATVVIDPDGNIRPTSPVREPRDAINYAETGSLRDLICIDAAFRDRFTAG